ncbi:Nucleoporin NIC96 [Ceratocystis lukuohia]|uniref:Nucleoporin NIC96 n=1 Tax=Ceratocystis lukuohia TaxID=2019550 RepID=A0ABR4MRP3_9PEZI
MFGGAQAKPSFGSLFASSTASSTGAPPGNSLFGNSTASTQPTNSLFGASTSTPAAGTSNAPAGNSLFNSTATAPNSLGGSSLFGASTATVTPGNATTQTGGSLFGNTLGGNSGGLPSTTPAGSLFGGGTAAQQTASTAPTAGRSLFGAAMPAATTTTTANTLGGGGSLFGSTLAPSNTATTGLGIGASVAPTSLGLSALAASSAATVKPVVQPDNQAGDAKSAGAYFDSLLASTRNQQALAGENAIDNLPSLQLGLGDIRQHLKKLGPSDAQTAIDGRAIYLLNASGVDPNAAEKDLGALGPATNTRTAGNTIGSGGVSDVDVETYLSNLQSKTTLGMIRDGLDRSARAFDEFLEDNMALEWTSQRKKIYEHFGIRLREEATGSDATAGKDTQGRFGRSRRSKMAGDGTPRDSTAANRASVLGGPSLGRSIIGTPSRIGSHRTEFSDVGGNKEASAELGGGYIGDMRSLRERQGRLAKQITMLNVYRLSDRPFPILTQLGSLQTKSVEPHANHVAEAYRAMVDVVGEDAEAESWLNGATATERQFAKMYLNENSNSPEAIEMRKRILAGANCFLERQFLREIENLIAKHPHEANLGGRPDIVSKIRAYIRLRSARKDLVPDNTELQQVQGEYVWAIVFYLLRSGHVIEAAKYVNDNLGHFRGIDRMFSTYLNGYASSEDRRLKRQLQERCVSEYTQRARNAPEHSIDPFRMACYKIIGRCELGNRSLDGLNTDVHDWVWLQFNLAREVERSTELASETFGLAEVQASIRDIGSKHFPKTPSDEAASNGSFGMFFYLQILCGLYEDAIAYLYSFAYVDAVHFAIALSFYGLLRPSDPLTADNELRSTNTRGLPLINFGRMVGYYTRDFRAANVEAAVDYLTLLGLNIDLAGEAGRRHASMCHEALRELVLETREFSSLIGDIHPDGRRMQGMIEVRGNLIGLTDEDDFITAVTLQAAAYADESGRITDSVLLYHLAGEYDTVVAIVARALSEAVALDIGENPVSLAPVKARMAGDAQSGDHGASMSLASIDEPVELARAMMGMYERDAMFHRHIQETNLSACQLLLEMSEIKTLVEHSQWAESLDRIRGLDLLPLEARGDPSKIRHFATKFAALPQTVAANVPGLITWAVMCCTRQRDMLLHGEFSGNEGTRLMVVEQLRSMTLDLTTYTSQLKYRFPPHLHEALARAAAE